MSYQASIAFVNLTGSFRGAISINLYVVGLRFLQDAVVSHDRLF